VSAIGVPGPQHVAVALTRITKSRTTITEFMKCSELRKMPDGV
jgi:hypothetical protein